MTTILVTNDGQMFSDSQASIGSFRASTNQEKITKVNGCLIGVAGRLSSGLKFKTWFDEYTQALHAQESYTKINILPPPPMVEDDFMAIVVDSECNIHVYEGGLADPYTLVDDPYIAIGSGSDYVTSACDLMLDVGMEMDYLAAMRVAIKRDTLSGGAIQHLTIHEDELEEEEEVVSDVIEELEEDK